VVHPQLILEESPSLRLASAATTRSMSSQQQKTFEHAGPESSRLNIHFNWLYLNYIPAVDAQAVV
jgi:hypothetical protein